MQKLSLGALVAAILFVSETSAQSIKNPYYTAPAWKLWYADPTPVSDPALIAPGQIGALTPTAPDQRLYPEDGNTPGKYLYYRRGDWAERKYAGMWDDVYFSMDSNGTTPPTPHSWLWGTYYAPNNNFGFSDNIMRGFTNMGGYLDVKKFGVNFTSQSTTNMGAEIANGLSYSVWGIERDFYFANALRAAPAHITLRDDDPILMNDTYRAFLPIYFNSASSSSSEMGAITKMALVGSSLPTALKNELKRNGLYIPTLLYIWRASFPIDAPYDNEMKQRVLYSSTGTGIVGGYHNANYDFHYYDEATHMSRMITMAKSMTAAPPIMLLRKVALLSGTETYFIKSSALIHQQPGEAAQVRVSVNDSFDLSGRALNIRAKLLYGNPRTTIVNEGGGSYLITVPDEPNLPAGRTTVIFVANNGLHDSNPATLNFYKATGSINKRPVLSGAQDRAIFPGSTLSFNISCTDPEGFPATVYKRSDQPGTITNNTYTWATTAATPPGDYKVTLLASDGTTGYSSKSLNVTVTRTIARAAADKLSGSAPLSVNFSAAGSADASGNALTYLWDFDDGLSSTVPNPTHTYSKPGAYRAKLTVTGPLGSHSAYQTIEVKHSGWNLALNNGWDSQGINTSVWTIADLTKGSTAAAADGSLTLTPKDASAAAPLQLVSNAPFDLPYYVEAEYRFRSGQKGDGIELSGSRIGWDEYFASSAPATIKNIATTTISRIGQTVESAQSGPERLTLRVYVDSDPANPGRARYRGWLQSLHGLHYFAFDNQSYAPGSIRVNKVSGTGSIFRMQVWKPSSVANPAPSAPTGLRAVIVP